jgi:hypothetical protein
VTGVADHALFELEEGRLLSTLGWLDVPVAARLEQDEEPGHVVRNAVGRVARIAKHHLGRGSGGEARRASPPGC